jgi:hypothetical protein
MTFILSITSKNALLFLLVDSMIRKKTLFYLFFKSCVDKCKCCKSIIDKIDEDNKGLVKAWEWF